MNCTSQRFVREHTERPADFGAKIWLKMFISQQTPRKPVGRMIRTRGAALAQSGQRRSLATNAERLRGHRAQTKR